MIERYNTPNSHESTRNINNLIQSLLISTAFFTTTPQIVQGSELAKANNNQVSVSILDKNMNAESLNIIIASRDEQTEDCLRDGSCSI